MLSLGVAALLPLSTIPCNLGTQIGHLIGRDLIGCLVLPVSDTIVQSLLYCPTLTIQTQRHTHYTNRC